MSDTLAPGVVPDVDPFVRGYEAARRSGGRARVRDHVPPDSHPAHIRALVELVRVDLEHEWAAGRRPRVADYLAEFPTLRRAPDMVAEIAYEEFRQRAEHGDDPDPDEYRDMFGVDVSAWGLATRAQGVQPPPHWSGPAVQRVSLPPTGSTDGSDLAADITFPAVGTEFLGFRLVGELGQGAFGRVYLAHQGELAGRPVALKVTADPGGEPQTLAQLQHTNIVPIYSFHRAGPLVAVCMPYFGSTTLADVLRAVRANPSLPDSGRQLVSTLSARHSQTRPNVPASPGTSPGPRPAISTEILAKLTSLSYPDAVLWMAARLADGLAHAHDRGVIHRDIKPANVLLTDEGQPMLLDFNLAADARAPGSTDRIGGTLPYMAPEHLQAFRDGTAEVGPRSDLYSLGLILFEMLTGTHPFPPPRLLPADAIPEAIRQRSTGAPWLRHRNQAVTPAAEAIIRKCLEPDPARRYASAHDLKEDIERHLSDRPLRHAPNPSLRERARKWARRHPRLTSTAVVGCVAIALLLGVTGAALAWREGVRSAAARDGYRDFQADLVEARAALYRRDPTPAELEVGIARCRAGLDRYGVLSGPEWVAGPGVRLLPEPDQSQLREDVAEALFLLARGTATQAERRADAGGKEAGLATALDLSRRAEAAGGERIPRAVRVQQADLLERAGDPAGAAELRRRVAEVPPGGPRDLYLLGHEHAKRGEFAQAIPILKEATRQDPASYPAWFVRGMCHYSAMQFDDAIACLTACLALRPTDAQAWHNRGLAYYHRKRLREAIADLDRAIELRPDLPDLYIDRAAIRLDTGEHAKAASDLTEALNRGTTRTRVYFMRAIARTKIGDATGAARDRAEGLKRAPTDEGSWLARAAEQAESNPKAALADVEESLRINPTSSTGLQFQAYLLTELGKTREAIAVLDRAVGLYPDHAPFWCGRGVLHARLGQRDRAIADARAALARDTSPPNLYQAGCVYALTSKDDPDDRLEAFRLLRVALTAGFGGEWLDTDKDLDPIRTLPEFAGLKRLAEIHRPPGRER